jgi:ABC-type transport system involved in cytochrome bd biosynthesis fused ATPase/permease subunit
MRRTKLTLHDLPYYSYLFNNFTAGHRHFVRTAHVRFRGAMSYAPQVPWLMQATIKDNIVCCESWDEARFKAVVRACALEQDFQQMPLGADTLVAEKGISLSGGQKQRVALARAAYRQADIYLLDNPISGKFFTNQLMLQALCPL